MPNDILDNLHSIRESLHQLSMEVQLLKRNFQYLQEEMERLQIQINEHSQYHSQITSVRDERGWQIKHTLIAAIISILLAATLTPLFQHWFSTTSNPNESTDPWHKN